MSENEEVNQQQPFNGTYMNNVGYTGDSILKIRLDAAQLLTQIETFLKGQQVQIVADEKTGLFHEKLITASKPLVNDTGVHAILSFAAATINSQTVQGNYDWDIWREEVAWCREQLITDLFCNQESWQIDEQNLNLICNTVMNMIKPFLTRLVNNEERKSYSNYQETRTIATPQKAKFLGIFG